MPAHRIDPAHPRAVLFSTKIGVTDAQRLIKMAARAGMSKSEYLRSVVLRELGRAERQPPDEQAA